MAPTFFRFRRLLLLLLPLLCGCAGVPTRIESQVPPGGPRGIVLVADGAGAYQTASRTIAGAVDALGLPLYVRSFDWTHGRGQALADIVDYPYARCQGRRLAEEVVRYRRGCPNVPIYLVGYSAGTGVVLAAGEYLPADTLERIVLLAPAVSACYDLRGALASARQGVDAFTSERDTGWLGFGTGLVGTTDRTRDPAAGRVGFRPPVLSPCELFLAARLHQHPWDPSLVWTGHEGGHADSLQLIHLKLFILPLLAPARD
jgi:hypothetical protein